MPVAFVIPIWKRQCLTSHLLTYYHAFGRVIVVGSEGDASRQAARGLFYVEASNYPLDRKFDAGFQCCAAWQPEAVSLVGSDDFITPQYFQFAVQQIHDGVDAVGILDFYLVDWPKRKVYYWPGYTNSERCGDPLGAGMVFSRRLLERLNWKVFAPYDHFFADDQRAWEKTKDVRRRTVRMADVGCHYWAVKTGDEYNPIEAFSHIEDKTEELWPEFVRQVVYAI
jgi:hypothetical protein